MVEMKSFMDTKMDIGPLEERDVEAGSTPPLGQAFRKYASELMGAALVPPVIAVLLATAIGVIPAARSVFVDTEDFDNDRPLESVFNAIATFGQAAVPLNMLVLGSSLARVPTCTGSFLPAGLVVAIAKMVVYPACVWGILAAMQLNGITKIIM